MMCVVFCFVPISFPRAVFVKNAKATVGDLLSEKLVLPCPFLLYRCLVQQMTLLLLIGNTTRMASVAAQGSV